MTCSRRCISARYYKDDKEKRQARRPDALLKARAQVRELTRRFDKMDDAVVKHCNACAGYERICPMFDGCDLIPITTLLKRAAA